MIDLTALKEKRKVYLLMMKMNYKQLIHIQMLQTIHINGFQYFADINNQVLYLDRDKKSGTPFSFLTKNEKEQMYNELRFPRKKVEEEV